MIAPVGQTPGQYFSPVGWWRSRSFGSSRGDGTLTYSNSRL